MPLRRRSRCTTRLQLIACQIRIAVLQHRQIRILSDPLAVRIIDGELHLQMRRQLLRLPVAYAHLDAGHAL